MFSGKAKIHADACRFCWMCRHICPSGLVTGKEGNTPRGRGLLVSLNTRGIKLTPDAYELMFQCVLCNACTNDCATGFEPPIYVREARTNAIVNDCVPKEVQPVLERALEGSLSERPVNEDILKEAENSDNDSDILLYLGESARKAGADSALALIRILRKANIGFKLLENEPDSGAHLFDLMGPVEDVIEVARKCVKHIRGTNIKTIVAIDPTYARFFKHQCNEWGIMDGLNVITATKFIADLIKEGKLKIQKAENVSATFHDPCRLSRDLEETEPVRDILQAMGIKIKEMFLNSKLTRCCGGAVLRETYPKIAGNMTKLRWSEAKETGENILITACPCCYENFSSQRPLNMGITDLFVLLDKLSG